MRQLAAKRIFHGNVYRGRANKRKKHRSHKFVATARTPYGEKVNFGKIK